MKKYTMISIAIVSLLFAFMAFLFPLCAYGATNQNSTNFSENIRDTQKYEEERQAYEEEKQAYKEESEALSRGYKAIDIAVLSLWFNITIIIISCASLGLRNKQADELKTLSNQPQVFYTQSPKQRLHSSGKILGITVLWLIASYPIMLYVFGFISLLFLSGMVGMVGILELLIWATIAIAIPAFYIAENNWYRKLVQVFGNDEQKETTSAMSKANRLF